MLLVMFFWGNFPLGGACPLSGAWIDVGMFKTHSMSSLVGLAWCLQTIRLVLGAQDLTNGLSCYLGMKFKSSQIA